jgi:biotin operon repressor
MVQAMIARRSPRLLADSAYEQLRARIVSLKIAPGTPLVEMEICARLHVSRTPVRAAIERLHQEGLVTMTGKRAAGRAVVAPLTADDMRELFLMVGALDGVAARLAAGINLAVAYNASAELRDFVARNPIVPGRDSVTARAALERQTIHIPDILADPEYTYGAWQVQSYRSVLGVPMLRGDDLLGVITLNRSEARPFTDKQIELVTTFADQAVIAIENTRLLQELQTRNRDLTEALEQQTATSAILGAIANSPTDFQPVLEAIAESATRLCDATDAHISHVDGDVLRLNAHTTDAFLQREVPITRNRIVGQAILDRRTIHIHDLAAEPEDKYGAPRWKSRLPHGTRGAATP